MSSLVIGKRHSYVQKLKQYHFDNGLCRQCGKPHEGRYKRCAPCRRAATDRTKKFQKQWVADGLCHQGPHLNDRPGKSSCSSCAEIQNKLRKKREKFRRENKHCFQCPSHEVFGGRFCFEHWCRNVAKNNLSNWKRGPELVQLWKDQNETCPLTLRKLDNSSQLDHIVPRSKGGGNGIENLRWVHKNANYAKKDLLDRQFARLILEMLPWALKVESSSSE